LYFSPSSPTTAIKEKGAPHSLNFVPATVPHICCSASSSALPIKTKAPWFYKLPLGNPVLVNDGAAYGAFQSAFSLAHIGETKVIYCFEAET
jgi:hypothetical protein